MEQQLSLHLKNFNKKVQVMNQTNAKELVLTALEARNIHSELFELLTQISALAKIREQSAQEEIITVQVKGGGF